MAAKRLSPGLRAKLQRLQEEGKLDLSQSIPLPSTLAYGGVIERAMALDANDKADLSGYSLTEVMKKAERFLHLALDHASHKLTEHPDDYKATDSTKMFDQIARGRDSIGRLIEFEAGRADSRPEILMSQALLEQMSPEQLDRWQGEMEELERKRLAIDVSPKTEGDPP